MLITCHKFWFEDKPGLPLQKKWQLVKTNNSPGILVSVFNTNV